MTRVSVLRHDGLDWVEERPVRIAELPAEILAEVTPPPVRGRPDRLVLTDPAGRAEMEATLPAHVDGYRPAGLRLMRLRDMTVVNVPRMEGLVLDREGRVLRETRSGLRYPAINPYLRQVHHGGEWRRFVRQDIPLTASGLRGFLGFDPGIRNYAHATGLLLQRLVFADRHLRGTAFLVPDLPDYAPWGHKGGRPIAEAVLRDAARAVPLGEGNRLVGLPMGAFHFDELILAVPEPVGGRWDMVFQPGLGAAMGAIGARAAAGRAGPARLYLSRQGAAMRRILNQDAFLARVERAGFVPVALEGMSFAEQAGLLHGARAVIGVHGAGMANLLFAGGAADLVELHGPPRLRTRQFGNLTVARGGRHAPLLCDGPGPPTEDIVVDLDRLGAVLDVLDRP